MDDFSNIINWENIFNKSEDFKNAKPFKFGFVEEFFKKDFYDKLYQTYPEFDETWEDGSDHSKSQLIRLWENYGHQDAVGERDDPQLSDAWNKLKRYAMTEEFVSNFRTFSGIEVTKFKLFRFVAYKKGGFQLPHIHNVGPSTLVIMIYLSKDWECGDPGGTYMSTDLDESNIVFEPHNLDNTMALFHDGPNAAHGARYITKNVVRRAIQITLEGYSEDSGWTGEPVNNKLIEI